MTNYRVSGLDDMTPSPKREKLKSSLAAVKGVERVALHAKHGQVSISCRPQQEAKPQQIKAAVSSAGFSLMDDAP